MCQGRLEGFKMEKAVDAEGLGVESGEGIKIVQLGHDISSVQSLSCVQLFGPHGLQHARPPCPSPAPGVYSNSCPLSW